MPAHQTEGVRESWARPPHSCSPRSRRKTSARDVGPRFRQLGPDNDHVIDGNTAVLLRPSLRSGFMVWNQMLQSGIRQLVADHRRVDLAVQQHLDELLPGGTRLIISGSRYSATCGFFERHPFHLFQIKTVIVGENAANPGCRCHRVSANAYPLPGQVGWRKRAALGIICDGVMLAAADQHCRKQHIRLDDRPWPADMSRWQARRHRISLHARSA